MNAGQQLRLSTFPASKFQLSPGSTAAEVAETAQKLLDRAQKNEIFRKLVLYGTPIGAAAAGGFFYWYTQASLIFDAWRDYDYDSVVFGLCFRFFDVPCS